MPLDNDMPGGALILHGLELVRGKAQPGVDGGMARVEREGTLGIYSCDIRNSVGSKGGAVHGDEGSFVSFVLCRISGSRAEAPAYSCMQNVMMCVPKAVSCAGNVRTTAPCL